MPTFSSIQAMKLHIKQQVKEAMEEDVSKSGRYTLKDAEEKTVGQDPWDGSTGSFIDSVDSSLDYETPNRLALSVFNNPDKMSFHASWSSKNFPNDQSPFLTDWLDQGHGGIVSIQGYRFLDLARDNFANIYKGEVIKALSRRGIIAK